jgi:hypothetical protein
MRRVEQIGMRVVSITARHVDYPDADPDVLMKGVVGVDTASAGFFDAESKIGVISASGFGDGTYECFCHLDGTEVVAAKIIFIA